jgi:regulator of protease activity HflC (stomatin/prohibitin superfamily)
MTFSENLLYNKKATIKYKRDVGGTIMLKILRRALMCAMVMVMIIALISCSKTTIKENEVGVVTNNGEQYTIFKPGEEVSVTPFNKVHIISTSPVILSLVDSEGVMVPADNKTKINIESQIIYVIADIEKVVKKFGVIDVHGKIREEVKKAASKIISDGFKDPGSINDTRHRIEMMAETNFKMNEIMNPNGIHISSFKIRYE